MPQPMSFTYRFSLCFALVFVIFSFVISQAQPLPDLRVANIYLEDENTYKPPASDSRVRAQVLIENLSSVNITVPIHVTCTATLGTSPTKTLQPTLATSPTRIRTRKPLEGIKASLPTRISTMQPIEAEIARMSPTKGLLRFLQLSRQSAPVAVVSGGQTLTVSGSLTTGLQAYESEVLDLIFPVGFPYTNATLKCTVDDNTSIAESDETNNTREMDFIVEQKLADMTYSTRIDSITDLVDITIYPRPKVASFIVSFTNTSNRNITPRNSSAHCKIGSVIFYRSRIMDASWYDIIPPNGQYKMRYALLENKGTQEFPTGQLNVSCENKLMNWCRQGTCYNIWFLDTVNYTIVNTYVPPPQPSNVDMVLHDIYPSGTMNYITTPEASGNTWVRVGVRRIGAPIPITPVFSVTCNLKSSIVDTTLSLPGEGGSEFCYLWFNFGRQAAGTYSVVCDVDPDNTLLDIDTSNNKKSSSLTVENY